MESKLLVASRGFLSYPSDNLVHMLDATPVAAEPQVLPEGLASLPPGPELASVLASVDRSRLAPADVFEVLAAHQRLVSHYQAQLLADVFEAGRLSYAVGAGPLERKAGLDRFSADEAAFTLHWSLESTAGFQFLAEQLLGRLPKVYAALAAGRIDLARASAFHSALVQVDDDAATGIVDRLLDRASGWTVANLQERLRYWVLKVDPDAARTRQRASVAQRRVYARLDGDGTAEVGGCNLPPDRAAAAFDRVDALARRAKADGDARTLPQLRADAYLDLLAGTAFATRPSCDPLSAAADTTHPQVDRRDDQARIDADQTRAANQTRADQTRAAGQTAGDGQAAGGGQAGGDGVDALGRPLADADWLSLVGFTDAAGRPFTTTPNGWPDPTGSGGTWRWRERQPGTHPAPR